MAFERITKDATAGGPGLSFGLDPDLGEKTAGMLGLPSPGGFAEDVSGISGARAIQEAQELQEQFGREALDVQRQAQLRLEETLAPFVQFSTGLLPQFQSLMTDPLSNQTITDLTSLVDLSNPALSPLAESIAAEAAPLTAFDLASRERGDLLSALRLGQASAAQQAAGGLETGGARQDLLTQIGNVQAAGGLGQAQALGQGAQNLAGLGTAIASRFRNGST
jgi:hypothetical protein